MEMELVFVTTITMDPTAVYSALLIPLALDLEYVVKMAIVSAILVGLENLVQHHPTHPLQPELFSNLTILFKGRISSFTGGFMFHFNPNALMW